MLKVLFVLKIFKKIRKLGSITKFMLTSGKQTITIHISIKGKQTMEVGMLKEFT